MKNIKRIIIKVGSSSLVNSDMSVNNTKFIELISLIKKLRDQEIKVLLVTSGAVALGASKLKLDKKPKDISLKQACAALGQVSLMETYEHYASKVGLLCAQILLSHDDFEKRSRMINLSNTLEALFSNNVLPIINENDALAVEEIKVGDNDTLSAHLVPMIDADLLVLISDIDGLYDKNPKEYEDAKIISKVDEIDDDIYKLAGSKITSVGTGGMKTKLNAAKISMSAGCNMIILNSNNLSSLFDYFNDQYKGTVFESKDKKTNKRMHWLIYKTNPKNGVVVDDGCALALENHKSLLPKGIIDVYGDFLIDSVINIYDSKYNIIAKGITNYNSDEVKLIKGLSTKELKNINSDRTFKDEVIHVDDLVVLK